MEKRSRYYVFEKKKGLDSNFGKDALEMNKKYDVHKSMIYYQCVHYIY